MLYDARTFNNNLYLCGIKVLSGLAHVKLMPVGGWCDKRFCRMVECKNNSQFLREWEYRASPPSMLIMAFLFHSQVIIHHRVLITQKCRLVTGSSFHGRCGRLVLITQKCRLVTGSSRCMWCRASVLITQKCRLVTGFVFIYCRTRLVLITQKCRLVTGCSSACTTKVWC